jgi:hypothetical protein
MGKYAIPGLVAAKPDIIHITEYNQFRYQLVHCLYAGTYIGTYKQS